MWTTMIADIMAWIRDSDPWAWVTAGYLTTALLSLFPTLRAVSRKVTLHPNGTSFDESPHFSQEEKAILKQHYSRIQGTLVFWKNQAEKYRCFHYYCLLWTIPISILIPIVTQSVTDANYSKAFLTLASSHAAILLALHKGFKAENNFKAFRNGESEFYDLYRRFLDSPAKFGPTREEQIASYFEQAEQTRKYVRNAETDNFPSLEETMAAMKKK
jgi:hypothetical protein